MNSKTAYYLIAVSNKRNLELCMKYGVAGFTNGVNGFWTYSEINVGDYVSFLYGARAFNLYRVKRKDALLNAKILPPWENITFRESGRTYFFPFRLTLELVREFNEPIVRYEFSYVAENLLLRGGYRKTHFQADQTTLQNVSKMGVLSSKKLETLTLASNETFEPKISMFAKSSNAPDIYKFNELLLQAAIKSKLSNKEMLDDLLKSISLQNGNSGTLEVLSEKALPQGHVDILIKNAVPIGYSKQIVVEIKRKKAAEKDVVQLLTYLEELGDESEAGILIANEFPKKLLQKYKTSKVRFVKYSMDSSNSDVVPFETLVKNVKFHVVNDI